MFYTKDHKTIDMFDNFAFLEGKRRTLLDTTWASVFRDEILPVLPVELSSTTYHDFMGRPTKELYSMLGVIGLKIYLCSSCHASHRSVLESQQNHRHPESSRQNSHIRHSIVPPSFV